MSVCLLVFMRYLYIVFLFTCCVYKNPVKEKIDPGNVIYSWKQDDKQSDFVVDNLYKDSILIQQHIKLNDKKDSFRIFNYMSKIWYTLVRDDTDEDSSVMLFLDQQAKIEKNSHYPVFIFRPVVRGETYNLKVYRNGSLVQEFENRKDPLNWLLVEYVESSDDSSSMYQAEFEIFYEGKFIKRFTRNLWSEKSKHLKL